MLKNIAFRFFRGRKTDASAATIPPSLSSEPAPPDAPLPPLLQELLSHDDVAFIEQCYFALLKRAPDQGGLWFHAARLRAGVPKLEIARDFAASDEARALRIRLAGTSDIAPTDGMEPNPTNELVAFMRLVQGRPLEEQLVGNIRILHKSAFHGAGEEKTSGVRTSPVFWVDLTTSLEWTAGVVGIVRAELELACGLKKLDPSIRFSMQVGDGFVEIEESELRWLLDADNVVDAYMGFFGRYPGKSATANKIAVEVPDAAGFFHPFAEGDTILSVGWMDSRKEEFFSKLKREKKGVVLCYLIYDMILMLEETAHFYPKEHRDRFRKYVKWVCSHCDFILFGGETAKSDLARFQEREGWISPPGQALQFGADIAKSVDPALEDALLAEVGAEGDFIICVGSIEPRKNHDTLYRAYVLALEMAPDIVPQLIICGRPSGAVGDLLDTIDRDPRIADKVIRATPTDLQLAALYKRCLFTVLPSVYEGWSLTLPESLSQGKFCLAADTPPLREIGGDLVDFVAPFDVRSWAEKIIHYARDRRELAARERQIREKWPATRWQDTANAAYRTLQRFNEDKARKGKTDEPPTIWFDMTLTYLEWPGHVTGIIRAELTLAYHLKKLAPTTRFFAYHDGYYFEIAEDCLNWLFEATDLTTAYENFHAYWAHFEGAGTGYRNPFRDTGPIESHEAFIGQFQENSVVFFAAIDMDGTGEVHRCKDLQKLLPAKGVMVSHLLYDFTPTLLPQIHHAWTCVGYGPFIHYVSDHFDHIVYGGRTAQRDGLALQKQNGWKSPPSDVMEFGSNLALTPGADLHPPSMVDDRAMLAEMGITGDFVMTVGTIEPRKNHEMLYKAFLRILDQKMVKEPLQMVFVGKPGWKTDDFRQILLEDARVKGKILVLNPSDSELHALYRQCRFTLLPSFYEGWSLTLPESLSYGKFCLVSDVDPLREAGRDLVEYIHPLDTYRWADRIAHYANNPDEVIVWEEKIRQSWHPTSWSQSTARLIEILHNAYRVFAHKQSSATAV